MTPNPQGYRLIQNIHRIGLASQRPAFDTVLPGTLWYSTDTGTLERATSTGWEVYSSSGGGVLIPHHATHEPGGSDAIVGAAWLDLTNTFTKGQIINPTDGLAHIRLIDTTGEGARILFRDLTAPVGVQLAAMRFRGGGLIFDVLDETLETGVSQWAFGGDKLTIRGPVGFLPSFNFQQLSDNPVLATLRARIDGSLELTRFDGTARNIFLAAGFGDTPLDASQLLSGSVPDARLSPNVALTNEDNTFTGTQTFEGIQAQAAFIEDLTATPLKADQLTGTVPDARLTPNVLTHPAGYPGGTTNFLRADGTFAAAAPSYEQGTWTPQLLGSGGQSGQIYDFQSGVYVKIGNMCHCSGHIQVGTLGTITGNLLLGGFPFPVSATSFVGGSISYFNNMAFPVSAITILMSPGDTKGTLFAIAGGLGMSGLTQAAITDGFAVVFQVSYPTVGAP